MNWDKIVKEIPKSEQLKLLRKRRREWNPPESKDGFIETWRKKFVYKGISFELAILRYYTLNKGFMPLGEDKLSDRHVVVERSKETEDLISALDEDYIKEVLWYDTLHLWNEKQTLKEQLQEAYERAISDIDDLPKLIDKKMKELKDKLRKLEELKKRRRRLVKNEG